MTDADRWRTSNSAYGSFWSAGRAIPLEPRVVENPPPAAAAGAQGREDPASEQRRQSLARLLRKHGLRERPVLGDGNCQFRALADQLYGTEEHHTAVREEVVQQLQHCSERYRGFVPGRFEGYLSEMSRDGTWGDHVTLQAAADALGLKIQVLTDHLTDGFIEVVPGELKSSKVLRLSFWAEVHYNSLAA